MESLFPCPTTDGAPPTLDEESADLEASEEGAINIGGLQHFAVEMFKKMRLPQVLPPTVPSPLPESFKSVPIFYFCEINFTNFCFINLGLHTFFALLIILLLNFADNFLLEEVRFDKSFVENRLLPRTRSSLAQASSSAFRIEDCFVESPMAAGGCTPISAC